MYPFRRREFKVNAIVETNSRKVVTIIIYKNKDLKNELSAGTDNS